MFQKYPGNPLRKFSWPVSSRFQNHWVNFLPIHWNGSDEWSCSFPYSPQPIRAYVTTCLIASIQPRPFTPFYHHCVERPCSIDTPPPHPVFQWQTFLVLRMEKIVQFRDHRQKSDFFKDFFCDHDSKIYRIRKLKMMGNKKLSRIQYFCQLFPANVQNLRPT